jgi:ATP-dependent Lon protease
MFNQTALNLKQLNQQLEELKDQHESLNHALDRCEFTCRMLHIVSRARSLSQLSHSLSCMDRAMEAKSDVEKQLTEKSHAKLAVDLTLTRAKKDIAQLNSKLGVYKTIESKLKAEFAEREAKLNQQLRETQQHLEQGKVQNTTANQVMERMEATEKQAVDEVTAYRAELMKIWAFLQHPREVSMGRAAASGAISVLTASEGVHAA